MNIDSLIAYSAFPGPPGFASTARNFAVLGIQQVNHRILLFYIIFRPMVRETTGLCKAYIKIFMAAFWY